MPVQAVGLDKSIFFSFVYISLREFEKFRSSRTGLIAKQQRGVSGAAETVDYFG